MFDEDSKMTMANVVTGKRRRERLASEETFDARQFVDLEAEVHGDEEEEEDEEIGKVLVVYLRCHIILTCIIRRFCYRR